ncbi:hypothetical protein ACLOJK_005635, partial [Asimina triloba]
MATVSVIDLLLFHTMERNLYDRLVHGMGISSEVAEKSIALWLWLESIGHYDLIRHIQAHPDPSLRSIVAEAQACVACLEPNAAFPTHQDAADSIPIMAGLINEPMNLRFFHYHRDIALAGITKIINTVCRIIFDDNLMREAANDPNHPANRMLMSAGFVRPFGENARLFAGGGVEEGQSSSVSSLNPRAMPWMPAAVVPGLPQSPEERRSMFLTFSRGYPIRKDEILEFFTSLAEFGTPGDAANIGRPR